MNVGIRKLRLANVRTESFVEAPLVALSIIGKSIKRAGVNFVILSVAFIPGIKRVVGWSLSCINEASTDPCMRIKRASKAVARLIILEKRVGKTKR